MVCVEIKTVTVSNIKSHTGSWHSEFTIRSLHWPLHWPLPRPPLRCMDDGWIGRQRRPWIDALCRVWIVYYSTQSHLSLNSYSPAEPFSKRRRRHPLKTQTMTTSPPDEIKPTDERRGQRRSVPQRPTDNICLSEVDCRWTADITCTWLSSKVSILNFDGWRMTKATIYTVTCIGIQFFKAIIWKFQ